MNKALDFFRYFTSIVSVQIEWLYSYFLLPQKDMRHKLRWGESQMWFSSSFLIFVHLNYPATWQKYIKSTTKVHFDPANMPLSCHIYNYQFLFIFSMIIWCLSIGDVHWHTLISVAIMRHFLKVWFTFRNKNGIYVSFGISPCYVEI